MSHVAEHNFSTNKTDAWFVNLADAFIQSKILWILEHWNIMTVFHLLSIFRKSCQDFYDPSKKRCHHRSPPLQTIFSPGFYSSSHPSLSLSVCLTVWRIDENSSSHLLPGILLFLPLTCSLGTGFIQDSVNHWQHWNHLYVFMSAPAPSFLSCPLHLLLPPSVHLSLSSSISWRSFTGS